LRLATSEADAEASVPSKDKLGGGVAAERALSIKVRTIEVGAPIVQMG